MTGAKVPARATVCPAPLMTTNLHAEGSTAIAVRLAQTVVKTHAVPVACVPVASGPASALALATPSPSVPLEVGDSVMPVADAQLTVAPAAGAPSCITATCGVHATVAPVATYSTGRI